jgi:MFS family permease
VVLAGSIVLAASLALASRAESLAEFQRLFGLLVGAATAAVFAPMMACVTGWFDTQRGLAVSLVSAGMAGRIGFGLAGDRFGAQRVLVIGLLAQAFAVLAYASVSRLGGFYTVAVAVGFIYAGTMPLYAVIIRENFPLRMMGTIIGGTALAGSLGMSTGPLLGGLVYDRMNSYTLMYVASWGMGLAAMAVLMAFRPFPARRAGLAPA